MDVDLGKRTLHRLQDLAVVGVVLVRVDAALDTDFGGTAGNGVGRLLEHHLHRVVIGFGFVLVTREAAEAAAHVADVGEVHVAVDDEADVVANVVLACEIGGTTQGVEIGALAFEQRLGVVDGELTTVERAVQDARNVGAQVGKESVETHAASTPAWGRSGRA